jgi:hypothetical protein
VALTNPKTEDEKIKLIESGQVDFLISELIEDTEEGVLFLDGLKTKLAKKWIFILKMENLNLQLSIMKVVV